MCSGGKALSTASFPQTHRKKARQAVPMSVVSVSAFRVVDSDEHFCQCTMRGAVLQTLARCMNVFITSQLEETPGTTRKLWLFPACACSESSTLKLACRRVSALERKVSTGLCFFERAKASDRPFKKSSESSFTFHNDSISLLSNFRRSNSSLLCSLQPCLLCALCLRFLRRAGTSYLQSLSSRFQFDCTPRSLSFCADSAGIRRVDPKLVDLASQRFTMVPFTRFRCSPRLNTRTTKTSKRTKQLSFSNLFLLRPAGAEVGRPGPQYRKLSAETWQDSQTSCAHVHCFSCFSTYQLDFLESLRVATRRC